MTPEMIAQCGHLLADAMSVRDTAKHTGIIESTLRKAIQRGVVPKTAKTFGGNIDLAVSTTKAERSRADAEAASGLGTACTRADERIAAAMGLATCATARFERARDVEMGGLLTGLPALCDNGLLSGIGKYINLPNGFYSCLHILVTMGFMALGRIRRAEGLRHIPPGELGKVIGLDRAPEVRTLREKITAMADNGNPGAWMRELSKSWMEKYPDAAGYLYVDAHISEQTGGGAN